MSVETRLQMRQALAQQFRLTDVLAPSGWRKIPLIRLRVVDAGRKDWQECYGL